MNERASRWLPERTADGSWTLFDVARGEACHSLDGAWTQALERYARPCRLRERAIASRASSRELTLLDVGTGLGLNLAAALSELDGTNVALRALSLEIDRDVLRASLALANEDERIARWWRIVRAAFARALASSEARVELELEGRGRVCFAFGDARETLPDWDRDARFDAVFLDPFSPRVAPELWEDSFLAEIARRLAAQALLSTYSSSFRVRLGLARAGLQVGRGPRVGRKASGTLASRELKLPPLEARTAARLTRKIALASNPASERETGGAFA
jgi:chorismate dehydratase